MPGTHRTPPDADGDYVVITSTEEAPPPLKCIGPGVVVTLCAEQAVVSLDALPALVAALAAHLTVDARRALTRDLAKQDGNVVVRPSLIDDADLLLRFCGGEDIDLDGLAPRLRAAVEAARPTPTPEETR